MFLGQTRIRGGRWQTYDPSAGGWVCAEPFTNKPEGMCGWPVHREPCPVHPPLEQR